MELLKSLAPNYWAGYYAVYEAMTAFLSAVYRDSLRTWPETEALFIAAAIFAVSAGVALLSAIITEGVGYVVLLIPRRIKQLKEEGRQEGRAEVRAETRAEVEKARAEERELVDGILARYERGEITAEQLHSLLSLRNSRARNGG